ncbi:MAG: methyltransferase [Candidatus Muproteobacteria bacterium RBG_16_64_11]|uniref:Methyltransferase n=1 Tax=Candidatus Muproteobacteria bacterium RBG_16_64_11 TaxID=1817758 RepID=A0A1F6TGU3_9PROT|nr:MAG: methyltransferase [Candidatus Muproteobacteria bacterium RBG_16_64_11]
MLPILPPAIEDYCASHSSAPSPLLDELERHTRAHCALSQMLVGPLEGALLKLLVKLTGARRILEIGLFTGYSALTMAEALPEDGALITCDIDAANAAIAQSFFDRSPHGRKIQIHLGAALDTLNTFPADRAFDLVFLDADKENYINYYEAVLPRLKAGGLIVADNVLWSGKVLSPSEKTDRAIVAFNTHVRIDPRVEKVMLGVRDGVLLIRKL